MTQPRQSTPGNINPRARSTDDHPGDVSNMANPELGTSAHENSVARLVVQIMIPPISYCATAATMATTVTVSTHQSVAFLHMTGIAHDVSLAQANLDLKMVASIL